MDPSFVPAGTDLAALESLAAEVARACGRLITDERPADLQVADTKSSATDVVTDMDRRSEALAGHLLAAARPDDGIVGEEGADRPGSSGISWLVDPIDGTVNYLYDLGYHAVSVAAVVGDPRTPGAWRPIAGAVHQPVSDELYRAHRGGGAWLEAGSGSRRLTVNAPAGLGSALVATGFSYSASTRARQGQVVARLLPLIRDVRRLGVASLDLCHVAAGRVDAYFEGGINAWDIAAGWLLVEEAGGVVRGASGRGPARELMLAGPATTVEALDEVIVGALWEIAPDERVPSLLA